MLLWSSCLSFLRSWDYRPGPDQIPPIFLLESSVCKFEIVIVFASRLQCNNYSTRDRPSLPPFLRSGHNQSSLIWLHWLHYRLPQTHSHKMTVFILTEKTSEASAGGYENLWDHLKFAPSLPAEPLAGLLAEAATWAVRLLWRFHRLVPGYQGWVSRECRGRCIFLMTWHWS